MQTLRVYLQGPNGEEVQMYDSFEPDPADGTACIALSEEVIAYIRENDVTEFWIRLVPGGYDEKTNRDRR